MQYVINVCDDLNEPRVFAAHVAANDASYIRRIAMMLKPLSDDDYMNGPGALLYTLAKFSYVLDKDDLFWLIEWDPGLIVIWFSPTGNTKWSAIRSPVPNFGGREACDSDWRAYDENADDPQIQFQ
jgi:hypothetical protein